MKLEIFKLNKETSLDEFMNFVQSHLFQEKIDEEIKMYTVRTGFTPNSDNDFGGGNFIFFGFRVDERKLSTSVKKRMLNNPKIKEIKKQVSKQEWKQIKNDLEHELLLKMPFGTNKTNIIIINDYVVLINPIKGVTNHISSILGEKVLLDLNNIAKGLEDKEDGISIAPIRGMHTYTSKDDEFTVKGELSSFDDIKKLTVLCTSDSEIEITMTQESFNVSNKAFFNKVKKEVSDTDNMYYSMERFLFLISPILKANQAN